MKTICEQFIEDYEERELYKVCEFAHVGDEQYNLIPKRFITQHEYEIFCKLLKEIIER
jgi:hypothetical protein